MSILGHEQVRARLHHAVEQNRLHHCLLFEGPDGVGKSLVARELALTVNCLGEGAPCGECRSCRTILAGTHPDFIRIGPDPDRATTIISADQARGVVGALLLQRHSARRRFVILDPADALTEEAGNILLKTLEEPPSGTVFILISARPAALLPTVRSRSQRVRFGPIPDAEMAAWAEQRGVPMAGIRRAWGSPGRAVTLAMGEGEEREKLAGLLLDTVGQPIFRLFAFTEAQARHSDGGTERARFVLDVLGELLRDVALIGGGRPHGAVCRDPRLGRWVTGLWPDGLGRMERVLASANDRGEVNTNGRLILEAVLGAVNLELSQAGAPPS